MKRRAKLYADQVTDWRGVDRNAREVLSYGPPSSPLLKKKQKHIIWRDGHRFMVMARGKLIQLD